jgi:cell division protein FtsW (lipid II flippase)
MPEVLMLALLLVWLGIVVGLGHLNVNTLAGIQPEHAENVPSQLKNYQRHAALLAQFMQVPVWLASGWVVYRWIENGQRARQGIVTLGLLLGALLLGLKSNHDGGAMLAQAIAAIWIGCGLVQRTLVQRLGWPLSIAGSSLAALLASAGALGLGFIHAPMNRVRAMTLDYQGPLDFLSMIHWLLDATPLSGFGIGNTPWCGYAHVTGLLTQCRRAGVPDQMQSDYVSFALLALWGWPVTLLILAGLLFWLWELMRTGPAIESGALDFALMRQWLVTGFTVTSSVHIMISTAGTLGMMPLTGVALPMLSLGAAGLVSTAIFAGLSVNRVEFNAPIKCNDKNKATA